jgi:hypothetical protein
LKQLALVEQQLEQDQALHKIDFENRLEEIQLEKKIRENKLKQIL